MAGDLLLHTLHRHNRRHKPSTVDYFRKHFEILKQKKKCFRSISSSNKTKASTDYQRRRQRTRGKEDHLAALHGASVTGGLAEAAVEGDGGVGGADHRGDHSEEVHEDVTRTPIPGGGGVAAAGSTPELAAYAGQDGCRDREPTVGSKRAARTGRVREEEGGEVASAEKGEGRSGLREGGHLGMGMKQWWYSM